MRSSEATLRTSELLARLAADHPGPRISLRDLVEALGERGFGLLMLVLALPNIVPGPAIPGFSAIFALPLVLLALQLTLRRREPRLPGWLGRRSLSLHRFQAIVAGAAPLLRRLEAGLRPRGRTLAGRGAPVLGGVLVVLALALALPIPFGNTPAALAIIIVALGLLERDGRAVAAGIVTGAMACAWIAVLVFAGARLYALLF
jgi:hypothetical protein